MTIEFLPEARAEANDATGYYEGCVSGLGAQFLTRLEDACGAIAKQPLLWNVRPGGYRSVNLRGFPYYVAFIIREETILIVAVGHSSRKPHYWGTRG